MNFMSSIVNTLVTGRCSDHKQPLCLDDADYIGISCDLNHWRIDGRSSTVAVIAVCRTQIQPTQEKKRALYLKFTSLLVLPIHWVSEAPNYNLMRLRSVKNLETLRGKIPDMRAWPNIGWATILRIAVRCKSSCEELTKSIKEEDNHSPDRSGLEGCAARSRSSTWSPTRWWQRKNE